MTTDIDRTIIQVERLYKALAGQDAPPATEVPHSPIPPERDPGKYVEEQVTQLLDVLMPQRGVAPAMGEWMPLMSLFEEPAGYVVCFDVPGVSRTDVHVEVDGTHLIVRGRRPIPEALKGKTQAPYVESPLGAFRRTVPFGAFARLEDIRAEMREGVLVVRVPKSDGGHTPREVAIS